MTHEEIEKKAYEAYPKFGDDAKDLAMGQVRERNGYIKCAEEYESLPKIHGFVARNKKPNELIFVPGKEAPVRMATYWFAGFTWGYAVIPDICPEITWESEPVEVELLIRKVE